MDLYDRTAAAMTRILTRNYSTSFSTASSLFPKSMQPDIYNIYGLVRIADEVVDTYSGTDRAKILDDLERETYDALKRGFSVNPIVQAFVTTAKRHAIGADLIKPFFASMRMDIQPRTYDEQMYETYIYGSAEVVGLMCLRVFCSGNSAEYNNLAVGARRLGAAYQKVNFLRDVAADHKELGRFYFPGKTFDDFDEAFKMNIIKDIEDDFAAALPYIRGLPRTARPAVTASYRYYKALLIRLKRTPAATLKNQRVRVPNHYKAWLLAKSAVRKSA